MHASARGRHLPPFHYLILERLYSPTPRVTLFAMLMLVAGAGWRFENLPIARLMSVHAISRNKLPAFVVDRGVMAVAN